MSAAVSILARQFGPPVLWAYDRRWQLLPPLTGAAVLAMIVGALVAAPRETVEGEVQRIFYIHLPVIAASYLAFTIVFVASIGVLWSRDMRWDAVARSAATVGVLFTGLTLATGSIWGKPIWGVWWAWEARLITTLLLFLIYGGYLLARSIAAQNDEQAARYAAVFAIVGFLDIPLIHMSTRWWRTLHPDPIVVRPRPALPAEMMIVLLIGVIGVTLLALWLLVLRGETERMSQRTLSMRAELDRREGV